MDIKDSEGWPIVVGQSRVRVERVSRWFPNHPTVFRGIVEEVGLPKPGEAEPMLQVRDEDSKALRPARPSECIALRQRRPVRAG